MLICLDPGHGLHTPGKRCLKAIDPAETREWTLNNRIARMVSGILEAYDCQTMRVDDPSGETDVPLRQRVRAANAAGADLYLSIHHNAGIGGGAGGGIVVFTAPGACPRSKEVQRSVYKAAIEATGLWGNRADPTPEKDLYVLNHTKMPAVLGEFGFMDSAADTPVILTEPFARQTASAIAEAIIKVYDLTEKEVPMTQEQFDAMLENWLERQGEQPPSQWAEAGLAKAEAAGITDGTRPQAFATRQEVALMVSAALG